MNNPDPAAPPVFPLPGHRVLSLEGRDAVAFAQAQAMNDVAALGDGQWHWSGWLTPKGRVLALFALLRLGGERVWLLVPDAEASHFAEGLRRFVFRSKVGIEVRDDLRVSGSFASPRLARGNLAAIETETAVVELDMGGEGGPRTLRIALHGATEDAAATERWKACDLAHGLPRLDASQAGQWTPQQLSLDRLKAYSVKKGCYPGQEIVARTHFLGQAKRELVRLTGPTVASLDEVMAGEPTGASVTVVQPVGQTICASGVEGLAVLPVDAGDGPFHIDGQPCRRLPLLSGLAR